LLNDPSNQSSLVPLLEVRNLSLSTTSRGKTHNIVSNVSFSLSRGETLAIVGESGSGKTLTALSLLGLLPPAIKPTAGHIRFGDAEIAAGSQDFSHIRGRKAVMIFQDAVSSLNPVFRVGTQMDDVLKTHRAVSQRERREIALMLLRRAGLTDPERVYRAYPHELSGGMAQRVMIAMALSCRSQILIADEPTTALDVTTQVQIISLIRTLQKEERFALLIISHDLKIVTALADRVLVMHQGRFVETGTPSELMGNAQSPHTRKLVDAVFQLPENVIEVVENEPSKTSLKR